jgi:hypothetical protein
MKISSLSGPTRNLASQLVVPGRGSELGPMSSLPPSLLSGMTNEGRTQAAWPLTMLRRKADESVWSAVLMTHYEARCDHKVDTSVRSLDGRGHSHCGTPCRLAPPCPWLEYFTVGWNVVEAVVAIGAGVIAGSVALIGFGADSAIEVISAVGLLWRLRKAGPHAAVGEESAAEKRALYVVALTFFLLAIYITWEALNSLVGREEPLISQSGSSWPCCRWRSCQLSPSPSSGSARRWEAALESPTPRRRGSAPTCH